MVRRPSSLAEAKQIVREEKNKVLTSLSAIAGSRWLLAILATFALAFGTHLVYAPGRLPPVAGLSVADFGLPADLDFGFLGDQAREASQAAQDHDVRVHAQATITANPKRIQMINTVGFGLALMLLLINMTIMTKRRRVTRG